MTHTHTDYQVLAPDSVAWHIQADLVADRTGNEHARDLALEEAKRIAEERQLTEQPAPGGSRVLVYDVAHECNGVRLAELERQLEELGKIISSLHQHQVLDARRVEKLERHAQGPHDGGFWITCPFCVDDPLGMCSACNGTRRIWEMPREDGA